ncbi:MAG: flavodoxin family protein [Actinobacteria bacterium]|nr:flavodoxin family protein [Actinomycetota bacterium]
MRQIVIFNGSPRMDGNTATLLNLVARGAREAGAEVHFHTLFKMKFMACQSCFSCRINDDCVINDEVHAALQQVKTADAVVIGSPIYMMQMTGPVKNLIDRFFPLTDADWRPRFGTKKMVAVYTQGMDDPHLYESYFEYTAAVFPWFGFDLVETIVCTNANDPESAERDAALKIRAYEVGRRLALD